MRADRLGFGLVDGQDANQSILASDLKQKYQSVDKCLIAKQNLLYIGKIKLIVIAT